MARTLSDIEAQMDAQQAAEPTLAALNTQSQTSIFGNWKFITSFCLWFHENLWDIFRTELETTINSAPIGTESWLQNEAFKFQYDSTNPQILSLINFVPSYSQVDLSKRIISQCSVITQPNKIVSLKVAKNSPPEKLVASELTAFNGYLQKINFAGVQYNATSNDPDLLFVDADITYDGQYSTSITASTIVSMNNYLSAIPFDGYIKLTSLVDAIQSTTGVTDVVLNNVSVRPNTTPYSAATYMVSNNTTLYSKFPLYSGYIVNDLTPYDFGTTLTFTPE